MTIQGHIMKWTPGMRLLPDKHGRVYRTYRVGGAEEDLTLGLFQVGGPELDIAFPEQPSWEMDSEDDETLDCLLALVRELHDRDAYLYLGVWGACWYVNPNNGNGVFVAKTKYGALLTALGENP